MAQIIGFLSPKWMTWSQFLVPGFDSQAWSYYLGSEPTDRIFFPFLCLPNMIVFIKCPRTQC